MDNPKKILVVTLSNLGDVVLTLPVIQSLCHAYPEAEMHVIAGAGTRALFEGDPRIKRFTPYDKSGGLSGRLRLLGDVRKEKYDIIVDLRHSLIGFFGGAKRRNSYLRRRRRNSHRALYHEQSLRGLVPVSTAESFLRRKAVETIDLGGQGQRLVLAAVGSKSDLKKWPTESYARLLDRLAFDEGCRIVLIGDKEDVATAEAVKRLMVCAAQVLDLTGRSTLGQLVSVIAQASLLITNDSAPLHIADGLKVPVLAIFGPTDPGKYGPRGPRGIVARRALYCSPCETAQCRTKDHACMKDLTVDEVHEKSVSILGDRSRTGSPRILLVRLDRIGDVVLSLPALRALRESFPQAKISALLRPETRPLLEGHPDLDEVIPYDYKKGGRHRFPLGYFHILKELRRRRFDVVFILHPGIRSTLLPFLAGIPYRIGYKDRSSFLLTSAVPDRRGEGLKHESEYPLDLLRAFHVEPLAHSAPQLFVSRLESARIADLVGEGKLLAVHAGSSCASKRWPLVRFERLMKMVLEEFPHRIVIIGGKEERGMGQSLKKTLGDRVVDLTGRLPLKDLATLLSRCELLVSNDSGPVHVAAAVGTRVISIFGRNQAGLSPRRWKPLGRGHTVMQKDVGCVVCLAHACTIGFECLEAIEVEEVLQTVRRHIHV